MPAALTDGLDQYMLVRPEYRAGYLALAVSVVTLRMLAV